MNKNKIKLYTNLEREAAQRCLVRLSWSKAD